MQLSTLSMLAVSVGLCTAPGGALASEGCAFPTDSEAQLERVPDCVRMGRHVRVGPSVSRGTAALGDGIVPTAAAHGGGSPRRIYVPAGLGGMFPGLFGR